MDLFSSKRAREFWGFMAAAFVFYLLSMLFETADLKNILIVVSAFLFIVALFRLRRPE
jgi:hypothetical protein